MPAGRLSVVVTRRLPEPVETRMKELFDVELRDPDTPMTRDELAAALRRADVLVPTITDQIDAGLLAQAGDKLKLIEPMQRQCGPLSSRFDGTTAKTWHGRPMATWQRHTFQKSTSAK